MDLPRVDAGLRQEAQRAPNSGVSSNEVTTPSLGEATGHILIEPGGDQLRSELRLIKIDGVARSACRQEDGPVPSHVLAALLLPDNPDPRRDDVNLVLADTELQEELLALGVRLRLKEQCERVGVGGVLNDSGEVRRKLAAKPVLPTVTREVVKQDRG